MKQFSFLLNVAIFLALLFSQAAKAQTPAIFPTGEKLTYSVSFANYPDAGFVEIYAAGSEKIDDQEFNVVHAKLRTSGVVQSTLLDLNRVATTFLDPENNLPVKTLRVTRENNRLSESSRNFTENQTPSDINIHDLVSALYQIRRMSFANNTVQTIKIWQSERVFVAKLQLAKRTSISTAIGAVNALVITVKTKDDYFNRYKTKIYLSDDDRKIPVLITLQAPQGEIRADLAAVQILPTEPETKDEQLEVKPTPLQPAKLPIRRPPPPRPMPKPYLDNQPLDRDLPFALGEKLNFEVNRGTQKVGDVQLEVKERKFVAGHDALLLCATAQPFGNTNVFRALDKIESLIDPNFLVPFKQEIRLSNSLAVFNQVVNFDQERGAATNEKNGRFEMPIGTHDLLSFVYALRAFHFSPNQKNALDTKVSVFLNNVPSIVTIKSAPEKIIFNNRKVATIVLTATSEPEQTDRLGIRLWLSDDKRRLPLKITFNSSFGLFEANLISFSK